MCAGAISFARIRRLYYAASDPKGGGVEHGPRVFNQPTCHHAPEIYSGFREREAAALLRGFFAGRRADPPPRASVTGRHRRVGAIRGERNRREAYWILDAERLFRVLRRMSFSERRTPPFGPMV